MLVKVLIRRRRRRVKAKSTREMIDYPRTRGKERMERVEAASNTIEMLIDILDRALEVGLLFHSEFGSCSERGKRDVYCDKQVEKAVTVLNCVLKGSWREVESGGIRKKLKSEYAAYLESKYRRNDGSSI